MDKFEVRSIDLPALRRAAADQPFRPVGHALSCQGLDVLPEEGLPAPLAELYRWRRLEELAAGFGRGPLQGPRNPRQLAYGLLFSPLLAVGGAMAMGGIWWLLLLVLLFFAFLPGAVLVWALETDWLAGRLGVLEHGSFFHRSGRILVENLPVRASLAAELALLEEGVAESQRHESELLDLESELAVRLGAEDPSVSALAAERSGQEDLRTRASALASSLRGTLAELDAFRDEVRRRAETEWLRERAGQLSGSSLPGGTELEARGWVLRSDAEALLGELELAALRWRARNSLPPA